MIKATADRREGILITLRDLLRSERINVRFIRHITLHMEGWPISEAGSAELEVYGQGRETAVVTLSREGTRLHFVIKLPKSGATISLSDTKHPQTAREWIKGWVNGGQS
ncbi:hypothetical protein ACFHYQ_06300 [Sphaerimonospora cavernae]|uniref:Uncharacterized protein n=1 Tax=Sphaerimonospora cavernae TaxID=1740611 RepID=A0ABV6U0A6_9ACTN